MWRGFWYLFFLLLFVSSSTCQASKDSHGDITLGDSDSGVESRFASGHMSIANMTCKVFQQPLNHFVPRGRSPVYEERYCTYDGFAISRFEKNNGVDKSPIFFYTGNESPLEQYINQVGWLHFFYLRRQIEKNYYEKVNLCDAQDMFDFISIFRFPFIYWLYLYAHRLG